MADNEDKREKGPLRLSLKDKKAVRHTLARLVRMRFNQQIDSQTFRDMIYAVNTLAAYDKMETPTDITISGSPLSHEENIARLNELLPGYSEFFREKEAARRENAAAETADVIKRATAEWAANQGKIQPKTPEPETEPESPAFELRK
jgi:hypothetical protein